MQSKGLIRLFAILLALASIWQLSFTAVTRIQEKKAAKFAAEKAQQFVDANNVAAEVREFVLDSVATIRNRAYIDSISAEKVYLGYTYQAAKEKEINLGLDLKGGMNVMLQVQLEDLVKALAGNSSDPDFVKARRSSSRKRTTSIPARTSSACSSPLGRRPPTVAVSPKSSAPTSSVTRSSPSPATRRSSRSSAAKPRAPSTTPSTSCATVSTASASPSRTSSASRTAARSSSNSRASRTRSVSANSSRVPPPSSSGPPSTPMR